MGEFQIISGELLVAEIGESSLFAGGEPRHASAGAGATMYPLTASSSAQSKLLAANVY